MKGGKAKIYAEYPYFRRRTARTGKKRRERTYDMAGILTKDLIYEILSVVEEIPEGKVASYGQIAKLIGRDKNARLVGKVLSMSEYYGNYPCHRVVNHAGRLAPHFYEQKELLLRENVEFRDDAHVNMEKCRWDC